MFKHEIDPTSRIHYGQSGKSIIRFNNNGLYTVNGSNQYIND